MERFSPASVLGDLRPNKVTTPRNPNGPVSYGEAGARDFELSDHDATVLDRGSKTSMTTTRLKQTRRATMIPIAPDSRVPNLSYCLLSSRIGGRRCLPLTA